MSVRVACAVLCAAVCAGLAGGAARSGVDGDAGLTTADLGGPATVQGEGRRALLQWQRGLEGAALEHARQGLAVFNTDFEAYVAGVPRRSGLGPLFNSRSCESCHNNMGRGRMRATSGVVPAALVLQLSRRRAAGQGMEPDPVYGVNINPSAIDGVAAEAEVSVEWQFERGQYPDGSTYELRRPRFRLSKLGYGPLAADTLISPRLAQPIIGVGLLEAIPEPDLLRVADPEDRDGDGVSGRPNWVRSDTGEPVLGRFGWKASQPSVLSQTAAAAHAEMGLTTTLHPMASCTTRQRACLEAAARTGSPELADVDLARLVFFQRALGVPARRAATAPQVTRGENLFVAIGCATCHRPTWRIATVPGLPALDGAIIHPFTDLLLHDMGADLADGRPDQEASGSEWRTAPLWGLSRTREVVGEVALLHDGRARSVEEAILWHGGEADAARDGFKRLSRADREALLGFLETL